MVLKYDCLDANDWNPSGDSVITPGSGDPGVFIICNGETIDSKYEQLYPRIFKL